jgi:hypothetical protein
MNTARDQIDKPSIADWRDHGDLEWIAVDALGRKAPCSAAPETSAHNGLVGGSNPPSPTSDFPPRVNEDPFIAPLLPTRLELINGEALQKWLRDLSKDEAK